MVAASIREADGGRVDCHIHRRRIVSLMRQACTRESVGLARTRFACAPSPLVQGQFILHHPLGLEAEPQADRHFGLSLLP